MVTNVSTAFGGLDLLGALYGLPGISTLINIGKAVGIAVLIYIIFLIVRTVTQILYSLRFRKVAQNVEDINKKMDLLIFRLGGKESKATKKK
jgi:hypothetical protein